MLKEEIKKQRIQAMKDKNEEKKNILSVALGEIELVETREGSITEERCQKILRKMIENNKQTIDEIGKRTINQTSDTTADQRFTQFFTLKLENTILEELLPQLWTKEQIEEYLKDSDDLQSVTSNRIDTMDNAGKAIGKAIGLFKENKIPVNGKDVAEVVKELREELRREKNG